MSRKRIFPLLDRPQLVNRRDPNGYRVRDVRDKMLDITERQALSWDKKKELVETTSDQWRMEPWEASEAFAEYGGPICLKGNRLSIPEGQIGQGTSSYISRQACQRRGGEMIGGFHTHPTPPITPSTPDLRVMRKHDWGLACIGTIGGDEVVVACFEEPESDVRGSEWMEMKRMIGSISTGGGLGGSRPSPSGRKIGEINMWEDTTPGPIEILEQYPGIIDNVARNEDVTREELKQKLREGDMPSEISRAMSMAQDTQKKVDLPVYAKEDERRNLEKEINRIKTNFDNVTIFRRSI